MPTRKLFLVGSINNVNEKSLLMIALALANKAAKVKQKIFSL
jgi:hypothetical protein